MSKNIDFGDYVLIEQKRYGVPNELYIYKVINGNIKSNSFVPVPVQSPAKEVLHSESEEVVSCICCGVMETEVLKFKLSDVKKTELPRKS